MKSPQNSQNPLISVIVPIYNTSAFLGTCLKTLKDQTYKNLEIICIDDGSTDNSGQIADNYAKNDPRIKVKHQKNQGLSAARNAGLKLAKGDYIAFVDSDDAVDRTFIAKLLQPYRDNPQTSLTVCGFLRKFLKTKKTETLFLSPASPRKKSDTKRSYILRLMSLDGRLYSVGNKLFIATVTKQLSFDISRNFAEDTKFVLDYLKRTDCQISFILEPLYTYNFGTYTSIVNQSSIDWHNWQKSYADLKSFVGKNPSPRERFWLKVILLRWRISHRRSIARAQKS